MLKCLYILSSDTGNIKQTIHENFVFSCIVIKLLIIFEVKQSYYKIYIGKIRSVCTCK